MSTAMNFGSKSFQPRPPDKGSFPLDHFGERRGVSGRGGRPSARLARRPAPKSPLGPRSAVAKLPGQSGLREVGAAVRSVSRGTSGSLGTERCLRSRPR